MTDAQAALAEMRASVDVHAALADLRAVLERDVNPTDGRACFACWEAFWRECTPANIAAILAHVEAQAAEIERLRKFAGRALGEARQFMSDVDGGDVQAWAVECGLLEEWTPTEPCGEQCECAEVADFPTQCYRLTEMGRAAIDALKEQR